MRVKFVLLFIALFGIAFATDLEQCQSDLAAFEAELESYSHYVPPAPTPSKSGMGMGMDSDMYKKKREEGSSSDLANSQDCFFYNTTTKMMYINCMSYECIDTLDNMIRHYQTEFVEECPMAQGFQVDAETKTIIEAIRTFPGCNRCVVAYNSFLKLQAQIVAEGCWITETAYSCDPKCLQLNADYKKEYDRILSHKICRMNNPGGCDGKSGSLTEGQIYDILQSMNTQMTRVISVPALCKGNCASGIQTWYGNWKTVAKSGCFEATGIDLTVEDPTLRVFQVTPQCNPECRPPIEDLISESFTINYVCMVGLQADHLNGLVNAVNEKFCTDSEGNGLFDGMTVGRAIIVGVIGFVIAAVLVLFVVIVVNLARGRQGWDLLKLKGPRAYNRVKQEDPMALGPHEDEL